LCVLVAGECDGPAFRVRRRWEWHTHANNAYYHGVADGERDHLRPDAGIVDANRRNGFGQRDVGERNILVDNSHDPTQGRDAERERQLHASGHDRLRQVTDSVAVTVNHATPTVTAWPAASAITYGQTLASSTLTGGTGSVCGTFAFTTP
jgi:hypothetical protein